MQQRHTHHSRPHHNSRPKSSSARKVLCPMERQGKTYWMRIGSAFTNADGSTNVYLDAFPTNGKLQIREYDEHDKRPPSAQTSFSDNQER